MIIVKGQEQSRFFVGNNEIDTAFAGDSLVMGEIIQPPYTELAYIENTNSSNLVRIDLDYYWTVDSKAQLKVETAGQTGSISTNRGMFGVETIDQSITRYPYFKINDYGRNTINWAWGNSSVSFDTNDVYDWEIGQISGQYYMKNIQTDEVHTAGSVSYFPNYPMGIFDRWSYSAYNQWTGQVYSSNGSRTGKFYYVKIWEGNTLVRDIIPVLDENGTPCVYDKVTKQYFYNKYNGIISYALKQ